MIINGFPGGAGAGGGIPFAYSGLWKWDKDGYGNDIVKLLTSGEIFFLTAMALEVYMGGGGGSGAVQNASDASGRAVTGGAGGYTAVFQFNPALKTEYEMIVGAGGAGAVMGANGSTVAGKAGGASSAFGHTANGGNGGSYGSNAVGASGGSDSAGYNTTNGQRGGTDGGNATGTYPGIGQGRTTKAFGEANGELFGGGGGSVSYLYAAYVAAGGDATATAGIYNISGVLGADCPDNKGGGSGGMWANTSGYANKGTGKGGSGVIILRSPKLVNPMGGAL